MNGQKDARSWHETVSHLVGAHGADPALIISCTPTLEQVAFAHFDTHAALEIARLRPPDGHAHQESLPPGWPEARPYSYRPFAPSPTAQASIFFTEPYAFPLPSHTGLPHTGEYPGECRHDGVAGDLVAQADLADWPSAARRNSLARNDRRDRPRSPAQVEEALRGYISQHADAARARWLASADFPAAPATPGAWTASRARQPARHVPHAIRRR